MPRTEREGKQRKKGYRKFLSMPRKRCRPYKGNVHTPPEPDYSDCDQNKASEGTLGFRGFDVLPYQEGMTVLSVFDGIATARCALENSGIPVSTYLSSEVDPKALGVLKYHYHNKIINVGCVKTISEEKLNSWGPVNLLLGGSPCQDLSLCNPKRRGLHGPNTTGNLFYEFHHILVYLLEEAKKKGISFIGSLKIHLLWKQCLGCEPVVKCASEHVPMVRKRYFWGNIPKLQEDSHVISDNHELQDYLKPYRIAAVKCLPTLTTNSHSQRTGKNKLLPVFEDGNETSLLITEVEALFGLPIHYTDANNLSITDRRKLLGRAWCVPVITQILKPLAEELKLSKS